MYSSLFYFRDESRWKSLYLFCLINFLKGVLEFHLACFSMTWLSMNKEVLKERLSHILLRLFFFLESRCRLELFLTILPTKLSRRLVGWVRPMFLFDGSSILLFFSYNNSFYLSSNGLYTIFYGHLLVFSKLFPILSFRPLLLAIGCMFFFRDELVITFLLKWLWDWL